MCERVIRKFWLLVVLGRNTKSGISYNSYNWSRDNLLIVLIIWVIDLLLSKSRYVPPIKVVFMRGVRSLDPLSKYLPVSREESNQLFHKLFVQALAKRCSQYFNIFTDFFSKLNLNSELDSKTEYLCGYEMNHTKIFFHLSLRYISPQVHAPCFCLSNILYYNDHT